MDPVVDTERKILGVCEWMNVSPSIYSNAAFSTSEPDFLTVLVKYLTHRTAIPRKYHELFFNFAEKAHTRYKTLRQVLDNRL